MEKKSILAKALKTPLFVPLVVTALIAISSIAYSHEGHEGCRHWQKDEAKQGEFFQKRQNELHDKLGLTSAQEPAWKSFVDQTKPGERPQRQDWSAMSKLTTPERLDQMLARSKVHEAELEKHVHATKDFYSQLTPAQQKTFDESFQHHGHHDHDKEDASH